ncbi:unnamed protein product, partial [Closterium sp. Naga37s-1]
IPSSHDSPDPPFPHSPSPHSLSSPHSQTAQLPSSLLSQALPFRPRIPHSQSCPDLPPFSFSLSPATPSQFLWKVWDAEGACDSGDFQGDLYGLVTPDAEDLHESWPAAAAAAAGVSEALTESMPAAAGVSEALTKSMPPVAGVSEERGGAGAGESAGEAKGAPMLLAPRHVAAEDWSWMYRLVRA